MIHIECQLKHNNKFENEKEGKKLKGVSLIKHFLEHCGLFIRPFIRFYIQSECCF